MHNLRRKSRLLFLHAVKEMVLRLARASHVDLQNLKTPQHQIPYFVLKTLYELIVLPIIPCSDTSRPDSLSKYVLNFFSTAWRLNKQIRYRHMIRSNTVDDDDDDEKCKHFLDLLHQCYRPSITSSPITLYHQARLDECFMPTIGTLVKSGIKIKRGDSAHLLDIKFDAFKSVLEIPHLLVDDVMEILLRNLVAFEQCVPRDLHQVRYITSYVHLMDCLIDFSEDAQVLERGRVVTNRLGHCGHVADFFNNLCNEVVVTKDDKFLFASACVEVNGFCSNFWPKNIAILRRDYFPNLWKVFAFIVALFILALAMIQTYYTVMPYYIPGN